MGKQYLIYLVCSLVVLATQSCKTDHNEALYKSYKELLSKHNVEIESLDRLLIVASSQCSGCDSRFTKICEKYIDDKRKLIIVNTDGVHYDISKLLKAKNLLHFESVNDKLLKKTQIVVLGKNTVDTVIGISVNNLQKCSLPQIIEKSDSLEVDNKKVSLNNQ